jgi:NodT family efflux transporter outer membrane factor (OMF) lipoprotein
MHILRTLAFGAATLALAACMVGPDYAQPETASAPAWKEAPAQRGSWPEPGWWRRFESPALDAYIAAAQRNNYDIGAAAARVLQADAQLRIAGASLLPTLDATGDVARQRSTSRGSIANRTATSYAAGLAASYEVDFWGRNRSSVAAAQALSTATRFDRDTVALTVTANVAQTYFQTIEFYDRLAIARENLENAEQVLDVVEARARNGAASPLEVAQQRTVVAQQRASIPPLEQQLSQSESALAVLLGQPPSTLAVAPDTLDNLAVPAIAPGLPSELLTRRPDIQNAEAQLVAANADIGTARAAFFPSIVLTGQTGFSSLALSSLFDSAGFFYTLAAGLTQPLFEGGRLSGQVDLTEARFEELAHVYRQAVISAFGDVETALVAARQLASQQALQESALEQARTAYELADIRYRAGAVDLLTVLDAQRTLFQVGDQLAQIKSARLQNQVALFRALGGGWDLATAETRAPVK